SKSTFNFNDKNAQVYDDNNKYGIEYYSLSLYEKLSSKNYKLDKHLATYKLRLHVSDNEYLLKNQSQKK
ncbi:10339_t:CDS:2, partial [Funneliformis caledonium]